MIESLLEMDANAKKYSLLKKDAYKELFFEAKTEFDEPLNQIAQLMNSGFTPLPSFTIVQQEYTQHITKEGFDEKQKDARISWVEEPVLQIWLNLLVELRDTNQTQIDQALVEIRDHALRNERNSLFGFALSVAVSFFGVWFISKSILRPLGQLTHGLRSLSKGSYSPAIKVTSKDEFQDLAVAFNEMSSELREQENLRADFIATLSHEIRTPLSSIRESVNLVVEEIMGTINEKQRKFLSIASVEITRINELLDQLMHASLLEVKTPVKAIESVDAKQIVQDCVASLSSSAKKKDISIQQKFHSKTLNISGRREEIHQVMLNIIGNAIKFSPVESEIRISVLKARKSKFILLQIEDQGPGVPEKEISLIFKKYYRSKSVRKHMNGVGLGLYISNKIVRETGGNIQVSNHPEVGCTFSIALPKA